uniref:ATP-binding cassette domain-containing protein n=1 Tax=candidate division WOR-3 bacterium TaxID=2052148 RepID=A0A7C2PKL7_UNCW3
MSNAIVVKNLRKVYKRHLREPGLSGILRSIFAREYVEVEALRGVSFEISSGEFVGYIGPNGAGKTTTMKILSGILYPTGGEVEVLGYFPPERKRDFLKRISFIMGQKTQLWWDLPAMDSFILLKKIYEIPDEEFRKEVDHLAELLNVVELLNVPLRKLSLGERMKMELIAGLLHNPEVIFLDEPTIGLDFMSQEKIHEFLKVYNEEKGKTIILTSHYVRDIEKLCKRIIFIHKGQIYFDGNKDTFIERFTKNRLVVVNFKDRIPESVHRFGKVLNIEDKEVRIEVSKDQLQSVLQGIIKSAEVEGIFVEELSLEDALKEVFEGIQNEKAQ